MSNLEGTTLAEELLQIVVARRSHRCFPTMLSPIDHEDGVSDRSTATKQLHRKAENYTYRLKVTVHERLNEKVNACAYIR